MVCRVAKMFVVVGFLLPLLPPGIMGTQYYGKEFVHTRDTLGFEGCGRQLVRSGTSLGHDPVMAMQFLLGRTERSPCGNVIWRCRSDMGPPQPHFARRLTSLANWTPHIKTFCPYTDNYKYKPLLQYGLY